MDVGELLGGSAVIPFRDTALFAVHSVFPARKRKTERYACKISRQCLLPGESLQRMICERLENQVGQYSTE